MGAGVAAAAPVAAVPPRNPRAPACPAARVPCTPAAALGRTCACMAACCMVAAARGSDCGSGKSDRPERPQQPKAASFKSAARAAAEGEARWCEGRLVRARLAAGVARRVVARAVASPARLPAWPASCGWGVARSALAGDSSRPDPVPRARRCPRTRRAHSAPSVPPAVARARASPRRAAECRAACCLRREPSDRAALVGDGQWGAGRRVPLALTYRAADGDVGDKHRWKEIGAFLGEDCGVAGVEV
eukprot:289803-Chlamydomonas_euryale.AAC.1